MFINASVMHYFHVYVESLLPVNTITFSFGLKIFNFKFQDTHNQAGIAHNGGLMPLLKLLDSKNGSLQHNAAFALYGLADNEVK